MIRILPNQTSPDQNPAESNLTRSESYRSRPCPIRILPAYASPDQDLQVFVHGGDARNAEVVYQNLRHIRGQEGRKCRSQMDVFNSEVEESQKHDDRLLLVPGNVEGKREIVDVIQSKDLF